MLVVPAPTAVTNPVVGFTVATAVLELLQVPPASPLVVKLLLVLTQSDAAPDTVPAFTFGFTVTAAEALAGEPQPLLMV